MPSSGGVLQDVQNVVHAQEVDPDDGHHHQDQAQNDEQRVVQKEAGDLCCFGVRCLHLGAGLQVHGLNEEVGQSRHHQDDADELNGHGVGHVAVIQQLGQILPIQTQQRFIGGQLIERRFIGDAQLLHGHFLAQGFRALAVLDQVVQIVRGHGFIHAVSIGQELFPVLGIGDGGFIGIPRIHGGVHFADVRAQAL